jgi:O-antigen/teichoic acid export membrane protein
MSVSLVPRALSEAVQGVLRGIGRYVAFLVVELALGLTLVAGAVLLLVRGGSLRNVIESEIAAAVAAGIAALFFALKYRTKQRIQLKTLQLLKTSGIFNIYAFVGNLYDRVDVLMLSKLAGNYATGIYGAAYRPIGAIQLLPYGILYSLLPTLTRGGYSQEEGARLEKAMGLLLSAAYAIVLTTTAFAVPAVRLLLGAPYAASAVALKILIWAVILRFINYAFNIRLLAGGHERVFVVTSLVCLAVNFVGNLLLIPIFSWRAAAAITVITEAVLLVQNAYWLRRTLGTIPRPFGWARTSLVFAGLWLACLAAARVFSPILVGIVSLVLFLIYLYRTGMIGEFAAAWRQEQPQGLQGGLSFVRAKA